jgi:meiotic recombination protein DMC1
MSVVTQLPSDFGGAAGKVRQLRIIGIAHRIFICAGSIYRYRRFVDKPLLFSSERCVVAGTFRPDRIRSIADRFGVNGDMALENILYGKLASVLLSRGLKQNLARAFNSEHQVVSSSISTPVIGD